MPSLSENRINPITMTFQTIDPNEIEMPRATTPSAVINKSAPMLPYYQQNLTYDYYSAPNAQLFDPSRGTPSPRSDLVKSPAFGPPPNMLKIEAPRLKTLDSLELMESNIANHPSDTPKLLAASNKGYETSSRSFKMQPETFYTEQKNGINIDTHTISAQLDESKESDLQSTSTIQIGNTQIQRNRRVIEEYQHTQKASTTEILKSTTNTNQQQLQSNNHSMVADNEYLTELSYGKGFVARQARRLSDTSQQMSKNVVASYRFPQTITETTESEFPISNNSSLIDPPKEQIFISEANPKEPIYNIPITTAITPKQQTYYSSSSSVNMQNMSQQNRQKISFPPPSPLDFDNQYQNTLKISFPPSSPFDLNNQQYANTSPKQTTPSSAVNLAYQTLTSKQNALLPNLNNRSTFKPTSTIAPGSKPSNFNNQNSVSVSDPNPASAGSSNKNLTNIGATSTPKRGRGVLNASVAPGGRIPKCGCCSTQIR